MEIIHKHHDGLTSEYITNRDVDTFPGRIGPITALWIQLTSACNLRCRYCYATITNKGSRLDRDLVKTLIKDFAAINGEVVLFGGANPPSTKTCPNF